MIEGLASRLINERKQNFDLHPHHLSFFFLSIFFRRCREREVRICCQLDFVDVMYQIWFHRNKKKFYLKLMKFSAFCKYLYAFSMVGLIKMKEMIMT